MTQEEFHKRYQYNPATDCLGEGGFGKVYKAYDTHRDRWVAIKMAEVKPHLEEVRLKKEVEMISKLPSHPNIAYYEECYTFSSFTGEYDFGILQYYDQGNLEQLLSTKQLSEKQKESILQQILEGIAFLHSQGIIHRDLKPQNILIVNRNGEYIPKITDFGISKKLDASKSSVFTNSLAGAGTLVYASPEQLCGQTIKKNTDLWSFGVMACRVLQGKLPFETGNHAITSEAGRIELYKKITQGELASYIQQLPPNWYELVRRCLVVDNEVRVGNAVECLGFIGNKVEFEVSSNVGDCIINEDLTNYSRSKTSYKDEHGLDNGYDKIGKQASLNRPYIITFIVALIIGLLVFAIGYNKNSNQLNVIEPSRIAVDSTTNKKVADTAVTNVGINKKLDYVPENFFQNVTPASPLQVVKNLFGEPNRLDDNIYFYDLRNCYLLISTPDHFGISTICIQSKKVAPYVKIGSTCPLSIDESPVLLGKSSFKSIVRGNIDRKEFEVGRDRCYEFIVKTDYIGRPCDYYSFVFGSFVPLGTVNLEMLNINNKFFENSLGTGEINIPNSSIIDYIIIGDEDEIKQTHPYGEGVHCDYF